ncbi:shikimate dehydrogenase [Terribacillus saccharophilus]|uniref:Shikimate dehydrogenase (NADP(+)) n=1 Tax=Terribacillus saccharophilus TaxID=361277 RepID=A0A268ACM8_9BACI|nr:shikimate dehydrogenase [Terribacillus saccharophilus]PAD21877.1 shikimate dehydrogenase [Terribacillus saccharophilus]PAF19622.1 shikimate dehydrogenase [Terribacillus saccharophilus]PAF21913.1 shikimate dehydrogenase [Terribacillus saccharophilus]PAF38910.1 shikimate dehydrogenase [Terribacillus saccharophilus]PAF40931.1 shikimate dehydrogenase [Terribacillus saccharophilus]
MKILKLGLIGHPVEHSLSPWIHTQFMEQAGVEGEYKLYPIEPDVFDEKITALLQSGIDGFNITVPYKQRIIPFLDELDPDAAKIGAVNTAVRKNGKWIGYNTDGSGYVRALEQVIPSQESLHVLMLGAGGAARGIYRALVANGFRYVDIANRTVSKAEQLLQLQEPKSITEILSYKEAQQKLDSYDIIIHTSSVGMSPHDREQIIPLANLKSNAVVSDIVYKPIETMLLRSAKQQGAIIHHGHSMLLYQAQYAFEIWSGQQVVIGELLNQLEQRLTEA